MKARLHLNITNAHISFAFEEEIIEGDREGNGLVAKANDSVNQARSLKTVEMRIIP